MGRRRILPLLLATALLGACGGDDEPPADTTTQPGAGDPAAQLFSDSCGSCHTLAAAGTQGRVGPSLDDLAPDRARVLQAIQEGPGVMPSDLLEGADAEAVADFVAENAGG